MKIRLSNQFKAAYIKLSDQQAKLAKEKITLLQSDIRHPSLRTKKMKGEAGKLGIYRMRVTQSLRITFSINGDILILRRIGGHDKTILSP
jgi:mRNA interferase RelE/StbE